MAGRLYADRTLVVGSLQFNGLFPSVSGVTENPFVGDGRHSCWLTRWRCSRECQNEAATTLGLTFEARVFDQKNRPAGSGGRGRAPRCRGS